MRYINLRLTNLLTYLLTQWLKKFEDMFIRFDMIHKHDTQTPHDSIDRTYA